LSLIGLSLVVVPNKNAPALSDLRVGASRAALLSCNGYVPRARSGDPEFAIGAAQFQIRQAVPAGAVARWTGIATTWDIMAAH
jgi:hypothetical protein